MNSKKRLLAGIIILGVFLKLVVMVATQSWKFENDFHFAYEAGEIGASLAMGNGYSWITEKEHHRSKANEPTAWEAPLYPFIIAAAFKVFGIFSTSSAVVLIIFQIIISAMICVVLFLIGRHVFNDITGILAALLFILNPIAMHFIVQKIYTTPIYILFLLLFIYQLLKLSTSLSYKRSVIAGFICGLAILTSPIIIAFLPFALCWIIIRGKGGIRARVICSGVMIMVIIVAISPWLIRNYMTFDRVIPVRSNLWRELWQGNFGTEQLGESVEKEFEAADEGKRSAIYERIFFRFIKGDPKVFLIRTAERINAFWTAMPRMGGPYEPTTGSMSEMVLGVYYVFTLLLGMAGICMSRLKSSGVQILMLGILSLPVPYYLTWFSRFRYRFPVELLITIFAAYTLCRIWKLFDNNKRTAGLKL